MQQYAQDFRDHLAPSHFDEGRELYAEEHAVEARKSRDAAHKGSLAAAFGLKDTSNLMPGWTQVPHEGTFSSCGWVYVPMDSVPSKLLCAWLGYGERSLHAFKKPASRRGGGRAPAFVETRNRRKAQKEYGVAMGKAVQYKEEDCPVYGDKIDDEDVGPSWPLFEIEDGFIRIPGYFWYKWHGCVGAVDPSCTSCTRMQDSARSLTITLREEQVAAKNAVLRYWRKHESVGGQSVTLTLPPGSGKTYTSIAICCAVGDKVLYVTEKTEILAQIEESWVDAVEEVNVLLLAGDTKTILNGKWDAKIKAADVLVVGKSTLSYMLTNYGAEATLASLHLHDIGTVVCDEAHHCVAPGWITVLQNIPASRFLYLTATPCRGSDGGNVTFALEHITGPIVFRGPPLEGNLCVSAFQRDAGELEFVSERDGASEVDYNKLLDSLATDPERNEMGVDFAIQALREDRTIVLFCNRAGKQIPVLVEQLFHRMEAQGLDPTEIWRHPCKRHGETVAGPVVACMYSDAHKHSAELGRLQALWGAAGGAENFVWVSKKPKRTAKRYEAWLRERALLKRARIVVVTLSMLKEGYDAPWLDTLILLGALKDRDVMEQVGGRGTRPWGGYKVMTWCGTHWAEGVFKPKAAPLMVDIVDRFTNTQIMQNMHRSRKSQLYKRRCFPYRMWKERAEEEGGSVEEGRWGFLFRAMHQWAVEETEKLCGPGSPGSPGSPAASEEEGDGGGGEWVGLDDEMMEDF